MWCRRKERIICMPGRVCRTCCVEAAAGHFKLLGICDSERHHWYLEFEGRQFTGHQVGLEQGRSLSADTAAASPRRDWCYALSFSALRTMAFGHSSSLNLNQRVSRHGSHRELCQERKRASTRESERARSLTLLSS